ncbi:histone-lysine N-methyltransferase SETDB1-A-like [Myxocyprinus asiaticus]|uniref:histone-lysine N-methyltransferase SETDB1-A-like n=1 Tax=Myxocyprinus asiaticus TaxID=70543 RepID=UPI002221FA1F|nr:histone-lysine N-methyltransferase SETDB1-A-like [Myxocyprinus asiaticus]XP_051519585.1 histone-lysine N-methyltransferase SETDB1-A-like [Myxocyprinus asiaticus]
MSGGKDENLLRMTKEDLQRWIQAEVDRNPQLMERREQLSQVEEWVKQKERESTFTRLLYSNACESVLECESVMKGLYGMLGLEYRDVDSEEEGEGVKEPQDVIHITDDDEDDGDNITGCDEEDNDLFVIDLGATKETLEPMLEKVTLAMQKSSRLVQDLVQMVKKTSSVNAESSSDITSRPSSTSTPEISPFESVIPTHSSPPVTQTNPTESLELTDHSFAVIKTESLWPSKMSLLSSNSGECKDMSGHNLDSTATIKTEPQLTPLTSYELTSLPSGSKQHDTIASHNCPSIKTETQLMEVTPSIMFSNPSSSDQHENIESQNLPSVAMIKTEPQLTAMTSFELSSIPSSYKQCKLIAMDNLPSRATIKTEPQLNEVTHEMSLLPSSSVLTETIASCNLDFKATIKTETQLTALTTSNVSLLPIKSENPETIASHKAYCKETIKNKPQLTAMPPSIMTSLPSTSEQPKTTASHNSAYIATNNTDPQWTEMTPCEMSSPPHSSDQTSPSASQNSDSLAINETNLQLSATTPEISSAPSSSEQPKRTIQNSDSTAIDKTDPQSTGASPKKSSLPGNSEQPRTMDGDKSVSLCKKTKKRTKRKKSAISSVPSSSATIRLRSSTAAGSKTSSPSSQNETLRTTSSAESSAELTDIEEPESPSNSDDSSDPSWFPDSPSSSTSSTNSSANKSTSKAETGSFSSIKKPAAFTESSDVIQVSKGSTSEVVSKGSTSEVVSKGSTSEVVSKGSTSEVVSKGSTSEASNALSNEPPEPSKIPKEIELKVSAEVLGKWNNKTWCQGTIEEIQTTEDGKRYTVEFKNGKKSVLPANQVASLKAPLLKDLYIGCRVVASSQDEGKTWFKGAVLAELPDRRNRMRFMVFYDDGQVAYLALPDLHIVCKQIKRVWKDIEDETVQLEVKEYLYLFPNPIAVVLRVGQDTKAERNGRFEPCTVLQMDGSLIQICFKGDKQKEWVYKGSDKLEHIVNIKKRLSQKIQPAKPVSTVPQHSTTSPSTTVTSATATITAVTSTTISSIHLTHQANVAVTKTPSITAQNTTSTVTPKSVTQQADTTVTKTPSVNPQNPTSATYQPKIVLQRLAMPSSMVAKANMQTTVSLRSAKRPAAYEEEEHMSEKDQSKSAYIYHRCCPACLDGVRPSIIDMHYGQNPLLIPLLFKFRRMTARRRLDGKVYFHIFYRSPCGRSLCDMVEVREYLFETRCDFLFLEMFCMDPFVLVNRARPPSTSTSQPHLYLQDISQGREVLPVPCINEVDDTPAPTVKYTIERIPAPGVSINTSLDFLTGCDCTDGCRDRSKCSCHQLTIEATSLCNGGPVDVTAGYTHKRLQTGLPTGVYECNPLCRCDPRMCSNRLVQHGLQLRLELFMTQHKGWGIRCKDDIAKGSFVCVFTGKIVNEDKVNEDETVSGNDYLANLDFIEGVDKLKEGYESEAYCSDTEGESNKKTLTMKTGPLWKNILYNENSNSSEEKDEPMQLETEQEEMDVCDESLSEKTLSSESHEISEDTQKNVTVLVNQKREGQESSAQKRCFARKSCQRRVKPLETSKTQNETTRAVQSAKNTRRLFNGEEACYIINARQMGNLGRYINHSCSPNLFVQNVFIDTHDLRFPWVAFFASKRIKAGTELTWDYNYEVGSVEGKVLLCCCGSSRCTGRLL